MGELLLELTGVTKTFPGVRALDDVRFTLKTGEVHALMGENGAGKSTFIKIITGVHKPDAGEMKIDGRTVRFNEPREAADAGIAAIYQHVTCYPDLSVTENIFVGHEIIDPRTKKLNWKRMRELSGQYLTQLGADVDPKAIMGTLSVARQQIVEIAKALSINARIIIMDEPTAALTRRESEELYRITLQLRDEGKGIIFISHRFEDMYRVAGRVTVLRDSRYIGTWNVDEISQDKLIYSMVGRELTQLYPSKRNGIGKEVFRCEGLSKTGYFADVGFSVNEGEIVALSGLVGAGRSEVCQAICGYWPFNAGRLYYQGKPVRPRSPREAVALGIGYLPEDRQKQGLILDWSILRNITLSTLKQHSRAGVPLPVKERETAHRLSNLLNVKRSSLQDLVSSLSGGNQQKVIVAKLLAGQLKFMMLDEPTKGVDVGAKHAIYEIMRDLTAQGIGILMVSSEMPEALGMSDRIIVMREGRVARVFDAVGATQEEILRASMTARTEVIA
ncbi:MAG: sugar ABC transporter ATP-binding protein [Oscillospiraceae bacterium]|jgi:rhamnose transport system ATP-binding protein|nr:sugar ABC transporter ATP-binding protein [Oscillospiraceae bacterium]